MRMRLPCVGRKDWQRWQELGATCSITTFPGPHEYAELWMDALVPDTWTIQSRYAAHDRIESRIGCLPGSAVCLVNNKTAAYDSWITTYWTSTYVELETKQLQETTKQQEHGNTYNSLHDPMRVIQSKIPRPTLSTLTSQESLPIRVGSPIDWNNGRMRVVFRDLELLCFIPLCEVPQSDRLLLMSIDQGNPDIAGCSVVSLDMAPYNQIGCLQDAAFRLRWKVDEFQSKYKCSIMSIEVHLATIGTTNDGMSKSLAWLERARAWTDEVTREFAVGTRVRFVRKANHYRGRLGRVIGVTWPDTSRREIRLDGVDEDFLAALADIEAE